MRKVQLTIKQEEVAPATTSDLVVMNNGKTLKEELSTNVLDKFSREVTVVSSMEKIADGVYDGAYESLVFKGKSLVNIHPISYAIGASSATTYFANKDVDKTKIKSGTRYFLRLLDTDPTVCRAYFKPCNVSTISFANINDKYAIFTTKSELTDSDFSNNKIHFYTNTGKTLEDVANTKIILCEYQEGMENWDIPYFTGLCDSKMPILHNVGKNLFDIEKTLSISGKHTVALGDGSLQFQQSGTRTYLTISGGTFKENTPYTVRYDKVSGQCGLYFIYTDGTEGEKVLNNSTSNPNKTLKYLRNDYSDGSTSIIKNIQIEEGYVTTTYEDHKSNILHTPEEIVLREVGGVHDTYNVLTGEYVQRIGEVVLDGSENEWEDWSETSFVLRGNYFSDAVEHTTDTAPRLKCNNMVAGKGDTPRTVRYYRSPTVLWTMVGKNNGETLDQFKTWLSQNPTTIQYILAEPVTTIVKPSTIPFAYKNGHIILESGFEGQSLLPELKYSAPASKNGVISTTSKAILNHEQRLHKLEDLLLRESILMDYRLTLSFLNNM